MKNATRNRKWEYMICADYFDEETGRTTCEIVFRPHGGLALPICRVYSGRTDAEIIVRALQRRFKSHAC